MERASLFPLSSFISAVLWGARIVRGLAHGYFGAPALERALCALLLVFSWALQQHVQCSLIEDGGRLETRCHANGKLKAHHAAHRNRTVCLQL